MYSKSEMYPVTKSKFKVLPYLLENASKRFSIPLNPSILGAWAKISSLSFTGKLARATLLLSLFAVCISNSEPSCALSVLLAIVRPLASINMYLKR